MLKSWVLTLEEGKISKIKRKSHIKHLVIKFKPFIKAPETLKSQSLQLKKYNCEKHSLLKIKTIYKSCLRINIIKSMG